MSRCFLIPHRGIDVNALNEEIRPGDILLPFVNEAQVELRSAFDNVYFLTDFVPFERICELASKAQYVLREFCENAFSDRTFDGIKWGEIFIEDQRLFYVRNILMAEELTLSLGNKFEKIIWGGHDNYPAHMPLHAFLETTRLLLGTRFITMPYLLKSTVSPWHKRIKDGIHMGLQRLRNHLLVQTQQIKSSRIVAIFATTEWERFTEPLRELQSEYGDEFQMWYLGAPRIDLTKWAHSMGITLVGIPYPYMVDEDVEIYIDENWQHWLQKGRFNLSKETDCPSLAHDRLLPHFREFFSYTLPHTMQWARLLQKYLRCASPEFIIGSAAYTYMTKFPYYVARDLGIRSIAMSHTYVSGDFSDVPSDYLACRNKFERINFQRSFTDNSSVIYCQNASNELSYMPDESLIPEGRGEPHVAILTSAFTADGLVMPWLNDAECIKGLKDILAPPEDLAGFNFIFKAHPRFDNSLLLADFPMSPNVNIWPAQAPLRELLDRSWVIVIFNHYGGVVVDAIAAGKPMLFVDTANYSYPYVETVAFSAGEVVKSIDQFWETLRNLQHSTEFYYALELRCKEFRSKYLQPARSTFVQQLRNIENKKTKVA